MGQRSTKTDKRSETVAEEAVTGGEVPSESTHSDRGIALASGPVKDQQESEEEESFLVWRKCGDWMEDEAVQNQPVPEGSGVAAEGQGLGRASLASTVELGPDEDGHELMKLNSENKFNYDALLDDFQTLQFPSLSDVSTEAPRDTPVNPSLSTQVGTVSRVDSLS
jgi:hypothetical protein